MMEIEKDIGTNYALEIVNITKGNAISRRFGPPAVTRSFSYPRIIMSMEWLNKFATLTSI